MEPGQKKVYLNEQEKQKIVKAVEAEFPHDPALQQVHIARRILAREAELAGMSLYNYLKQLSHEIPE